MMFLSIMSIILLCSRKQKSETHARRAASNETSTVEKERTSATRTPQIQKVVAGASLKKEKNAKGLIVRRQSDYPSMNDALSTSEAATKVNQ